MTYQALQVTGQHAPAVLKADAQGSWDPSTKPLLVPPTQHPSVLYMLFRFLFYKPGRADIWKQFPPSLAWPPTPLFLATVPQAEPGWLLDAAAWGGAGLSHHSQLGPLPPLLK